MVASTYRPRNAGHDYYGRGTYLITLVVSGREPLLSHFSDKGRDALKGDDILTLTLLGEVVEQTGSWDLCFWWRGKDIDNALKKRADFLAGSFFFRNFAVEKAARLRLAKL